MIKGTLVVEAGLTKKGTPNAKVEVEGQKPKNYSSKDKNQLEIVKRYLGKSVEVDVELDNGQLRTVVIAETGETILGDSVRKKMGQENIKSKGPKNHTQGGKGKDSQSAMNRPLGRAATAPYNFIPVPPTSSPAGKFQPVDQFVEGCYSGYLDVEYRNLKEMFIRSGEGDKASEFFGPGGRLQLPGSSLRGMARSIFEILTRSRMRFVDDQQLFYRCVAKDDNRKYKHRLGENVRAAWISKTARSYKIRFAQTSKNAPQGFYRTNQSIVDEKRIAPFEFQLIDPVQPSDSTDKGLVKKVRAPTIQGQGAALLNSGEMKGKQKAYIVAEPTDNDARTISKESMERIYEVDRKDKHGLKLDLLKRLDSDKNGGRELPCFVLMEDNRIIGLGHTYHLRIPYKHTVRELIPEGYAPSNGPEDWVEAVFGTDLDRTDVSGAHAGRVSFENAIHTVENSDESKQAMLKEGFAKILSGPKPTSFQLYLEQQPDVSKDTINTWENSDAKIRGFKRYWHQENVDWKDPSGVEGSSQHTKMRPIKAVQKFYGRVHFSNLSAAELGALWASIELGKPLAHKLGMGKPLGLGSLKADVKRAWIADPQQLKESHKSVFQNKKVNVKQDPKDSMFIQAFGKELYGLDVTSLEEFWKQVQKGGEENLKELHVMLDFDNRMTDGQVGYMGFVNDDRWKNREVLKSPSETISRN